MTNSTNTIETFTALTATEFTDKYKAHKVSIDGGTLCFWGHWFGKPHDNFHQITSVNFDATNNILIIHFSEQETLTITNPNDISEYKDRIVIAKADRVHWQWYYYGKTPTPENLYYYHIDRKDKILNAMTNVTWYKPDWNDLATEKPALLLT